jgi:3-dehydroquinate dehydratase / shikimate dehydrogenase
MICISIAQASRKLVLVDMFNAAPQCDLLEIRLDSFGKAPDIGELFARKPKPLIFSCRRPKDGGRWDGSEEERLALLRQCIVSKADYVEIELDVADQIRKFPPTKRVISYTNLQQTPANIAEIYAQAQTKNPDVIKLTTAARTPEEAWPLLQILAKATVPTVVVGLGKPGIMLSVLGKKIGAPWTYAALERGMEAYPDQPTVRDLEDVYHYRSLESSTRLIGVTGLGNREYKTVAAVNAALAHLGVSARCLPVALGSIPIFRKVMDAVHLAAVIVDAEHQGAIVSVASQLDAAAREAHAADLLIRKEKTWYGCNTLGQAAVTALEAAVRGTGTAGQPLQGRMVVVVGTNAMARAMAQGIKQRGGVLIIASRNRKAATELAQVLECRHIQLEAVYSTMHDILVVCSEEKEAGKSKGSSSEGGIHAGYLRPGMTVMDLTTAGRSLLLDEAHARRCAVVSPKDLLREQLALQIHLLTNREPPREVLDRTLTDLYEQEL